MGDQPAWLTPQKISMDWRITLTRFLKFPHVMSQNITTNFWHDVVKSQTRCRRSKRSKLSASGVLRSGLKKRNETTSTSTMRTRRYRCTNSSQNDTEMTTLSLIPVVFYDSGGCFVVICFTANFICKKLARQHGRWSWWSREMDRYNILKTSPVTKLWLLAQVCK